MTVHIKTFTERTNAPGFYEMTAEQYHADPCITPSLSSSIAKVLLRKTPRHAYAAHPRYTPQEERISTPAMLLGSAVHKLVLGVGAAIVVIEADDFKTKAAQLARDTALAAGKIPLLLETFNKADKIAERVREGLSEIKGAERIFVDGRREMVAIWQEPNGIMCRAMMDSIDFRTDRVVIDDLKTSRDDIEGGGDLGKKISNMSYEVSAGFYSRGVKLLTGLPVAFRFAFIETDEPFEVVVTELDGAAAEIGRRQAAAAVHLWGQCQDRNKWPGFPRQITRSSLPGWASASWEARETNDEALSAVDYGEPK